MNYERLKFNWVNLLYFQGSTDPSKQDNPFRDSGQLSEYARDIVDAVKAGTLSQMAQSSGRGEAGDTPAQGPTITVTSEEEGAGRGQQGEHRGSKEIKVEHALVISPKHSDIEHILIPEEKLKKKCACCILM